MQRLERLTGTTVHLRRGLLWRDGDGLADVVAALAGEGVRHEVVDAGDVGRRLPGLRARRPRRRLRATPRARVLAAASLRAQLGLFEAAGGTVERVRVRAVRARRRRRPDRPRRRRHALGRRRRARARPRCRAAPATAWACRWPCTRAWSRSCTSGTRPTPGATDGYACLVDRPHRADDGSDVPNLYAMPTPGRGYKVGDRPAHPRPRRGRRRPHARRGHHRPDRRRRPPRHHRRPPAAPGRPGLLAGRSHPTGASSSTPCPAGWCSPAATRARASSSPR